MSLVSKLGVGGGGSRAMCFCSGSARVPVTVDVFTGIVLSGWEEQEAQLWVGRLRLPLERTARLHPPRAPRLVTARGNLPTLPSTQQTWEGHSLCAEAVPSLEGGHVGTVIILRPLEKHLVFQQGRATCAVTCQRDL